QALELLALAAAVEELLGELVGGGLVAPLGARIQRHRHRAVLRRQPAPAKQDVLDGSFLRRRGAVEDLLALDRVVRVRAGEQEQRNELFHRSPSASTPLKRCTPVPGPAGPSSKLVRHASSGNSPSAFSIRRTSSPGVPWSALPRLAQSK